MIQSASRLQLLFLGAAFSEDTMLARAAVSTAANRWQRGLLRGLASLGVTVRVVGHVPEPVWPRGRMRVRPGFGQLLAGIQGDLVPYWNLPWLRTTSLTHSFLRALRASIPTRGRPSCLLSYNLHPHTVALARFASEQHSVPWVCIVADAPDTKPEWDRHDAWLKEAAGRVYLSRKCFEESRRGPSLHLDGGIEDTHFASQAAEHRPRTRGFLYSGAMNHYGGVGTLVKAFRRINDNDVELWVCGKGENEELRANAARDSRIKWYGVVTDERLMDLSNRAFAFVNPRPVGLTASAGNFPSKVLEYLSYGKPVISTWTPGLAVEYREVLTVLDEDSPDCLAAAMRDTLRLSRSELQTIGERIREFVNRDKLWSVQADRLATWLCDEVLPGRSQ